jgi:GT2 family glycosyltransferase
MQIHGKDEARPPVAANWPETRFPAWSLPVALCADLDVLIVGAADGDALRAMGRLARSFHAVESVAGARDPSADLEALAANPDGSADCIVISAPALRGEGAHQRLVEIRRILREDGFLLIASGYEAEGAVRSGEDPTRRSLAPVFPICIAVHIDVTVDHLPASSVGLSTSRPVQTGRAVALWHLACGDPVPNVLREMLTTSPEAAPPDAIPVQDLGDRLRQVQREVVGLNGALALAQRSRKDRFKASSIYAGIRAIERTIRRSLRGQGLAEGRTASALGTERGLARLLKVLTHRVGSDQVSFDALDYVRSRHGEPSADLCRDLLGVVGRFAGQRARFIASDDCARLLNEARELARLNETDAPDASIIIPVHDGLHLTLPCIVSILKTMGTTSVEIIVADDLSTDGTEAAVASIGGCVRLLRQQVNLGFLGNCNAAAAHARGRHLVFLNNDTVVLPNWLDALVRLLDADPSVGLAGSKLLNVDGTLQEAGGIFWQDGSAWNFGRNQDPRLPAFNYVKEVDYVSGASIAIPARIWQEMHGFDPLFAPAYCEDSDFAFRLRERGYRVVYQPYSELFHHEGQSHGVSTGAGIKAYQVVNLKTFHERWRAVLEAEHFEPGVNIFEARDRSRGRPHIVIVDHYIPQPDRDAGSRSIHMYIRLFVEAGFQVSFWADNLFPDPDYKPIYEQMGVEVMCGESCRNRFATWLAERADKVGYVLLSRPHIAMGYLEAVSRYPGIKRLYFGHDLHFQRMEREYAVTARPALKREIVRMRQLEESVIKSCHLAIYPNADEVAFAMGLAPHVEGLELPVYLVAEDRLAEVERRTAPRERSEVARLLFVGGFAHFPNVDGAIWLVEEVLPRLRQMGRPFHLTIVGSNMPDAIRTLAGPDIEPRGWVPDAELNGLYASADLAVAPLRYGGGVKGKVIEALARGTPLVTGSVGVQGIPEPHRLALVADTAEDFARAISATLDDPAAAAERVRNAIAFLRQNYTSSAARRALARHVPELR